ncbi:MAG: polysaccharide deacetylase [Candidatus Eremiobacteraeota bacterium]|nr:polysaccharide deacetylase [Candidatus Eremiobacteraeota bacterium]MBV8354178.1 polysaccharide deacetylase [Candidatus Eremiobacteraeota bacterium]
MRKPPARYEAAPRRKHLRFPEGVRLVVHAIVNVEDWHLDARLPRTVLSAPTGAEPVPDVANWSWYQYGMRVGIWRLFDVLSPQRGHVTLALNAEVCASYAPIVEEAVRSGWEMMGHGFYQRPATLVEDERAMIRETLATIERATTTRPRGWLGPGLVETWETLAILASEGLTYCCDWGPADDLPFELAAGATTLLAVPYPIEMNDIVIYGLEKRPDDEIFERGKRYFDVLYRESEGQAKIMPIALHPWITGMPNRIGALDELLRYVRAKPGVAFMSGGEIVDWYRGCA